MRLIAILRLPGCSLYLKFFRLIAAMVRSFPRTAVPDYLNGALLPDPTELPKNKNAPVVLVSSGMAGTHSRVLGNNIRVEPLIDGVLYPVRPCSLQ